MCGLISVEMTVAQTAPNFILNRQDYETPSQLDHSCGAIPNLPWRSIWSADNPGEVLNEHLSLLIGRLYQL